MDFDDLDDIEAEAGPTPAERRDAMLKEMLVESKFPVATGRNFAADGKMKMLFLHGGGTNNKLAKMQVNNVFKACGLQDAITWEYLEGPIKCPLSWHNDDTMTATLAPFGPDFFLYFDRMPYANAQAERWEGIEKSVDLLKKHFKENGPYDGVCGFDMGGELLLHAAVRAMAGEQGFTEMFRFMILVSTGTSRHLSKMGKEGWRPNAPLQLPVCMIFSREDENHPFSWYEETALMCDPRFREVIIHTDGHRPPGFKSGNEDTSRLLRFLQTMQKGDDFVPSDHTDNSWNRDIYLPLKTFEPAKLPPTARRRLLVVHDPLGVHDLPYRLMELENAAKSGVPMIRGREGSVFKMQGVYNQLEEVRCKASAFALTKDSFSKAEGSGISIESVEYTEEQMNFDWHTKQEQLASRQWSREDSIDLEYLEMTSRKWADHLMKDFIVEPDDYVGVVGIGTGAFIALAICKMLVREHKTVPAGFWVVEGPNMIPYASTMVPGALVDCPVDYFVNSYSLRGTPWRYDVSTFGPFSVITYTDIQEVVNTIITNFNAR